jgi:hypothetical protein
MVFNVEKNNLEQELESISSPDLEFEKTVTVPSFYTKNLILQK